MVNVSVHAAIAAVWPAMLQNPVNRELAHSGKLDECVSFTGLAESIVRCSVALVDGIELAVDRLERGPAAPAEEDEVAS